MVGNMEKVMQERRMWDEAGFPAKGAENWLQFLVD